MNYVEKFFDGVQSVLNVNAATFSGACDIIVVRRVSPKPDCENWINGKNYLVSSINLSKFKPDGSLHSTPFHVRFGKLKLISSREKTVSFFQPDATLKIQRFLAYLGKI